MKLSLYVGVVLRCKHHHIKYSLLFWSEREQIISHLERFPFGIEFWFKFGFASDENKHLIQYYTFSNTLVPLLHPLRSWAHLSPRAQLSAETPNQMVLLSMLNSFCGLVLVLKLAAKSSRTSQEELDLWVAVEEIQATQSGWDFITATVSDKNSPAAELFLNSRFHLRKSSNTFPWLWILEGC